MLAQLGSLGFFELRTPVITNPSPESGRRRQVDWERDRVIHAEFHSPAGALVGFRRDVVRANVWIGRQPSDLVDDLTERHFPDRGVDCHRRSSIGPVEQFVSCRQPERCRLLLIHENGSDYPWAS
jgi:hypothetical protein